MENKKGDNIKINKENFHYVYFIEIHEISRNIVLSLPENSSSEFNTLDIIDQTKMDNFETSLLINIYRFKIYPDKILEKYKDIKNLEIEINVIEENKNIFKSKINIFDINHDNYLYDFKINYDNNMNILLAMEELFFGYSKQFQIFINYFRKNKINQNSKENDELIYSTLKILNKEENKNKKYDFSFLISILLESFKSQYLPKLFEIFKPQKINNYGDIPKDKIKPIINIFKIIEKRIFESFEKEENKEELIFNLCTLLLYINSKFNKEKFDEMLKNEKIKNYLFKSLIINENIFMGLILTKEQIIELINFCDNIDFIQLINKLKYNNNFLILLQIINEKKDLFLKKFLECKEETFIDIELLILIKNEDNLNAIYDQIKDIISFEQNSKHFFVNFSPHLIENYINLFDNIDLEKLISLSKLIILLQKELPKFNIKNNIDEIIHRTAINLSKEKKLKNMEILNFIEKNIYYKEKIYKNTNYRSVEILSGIEIASINDEFLNKWKKLKFFTIFQSQREFFINKVCKLIKEMKYFNLLFILLQENDDIIDYDYLIISNMKTVFEVLIPTYSPEKCPNFINDIINLIYWTDKKNVNSEDFNKEKIQIILNKETVKTIYINLAKKYNNLSKELNNIIIKYFTENPLIINPVDLIDIIKNSKELRIGLFKNMGKYIITENEIYQKEDSDNFKLLEGLIKEGFFNFDNKDNNNKDDENNIKSSEYIVKSSSAIKKIINNIKKNNIKYSKINYIFENNLEKNFYKRLLILFQLYNEDLKLYENELQKRYLETKKNLQLFEIFLNDFSFFYPEKHKNEII